MSDKISAQDKVCKEHGVPVHIIFKNYFYLQLVKELCFTSANRTVTVYMKV